MLLRIGVVFVVDNAGSAAVVIMTMRELRSRWLNPITSGRILNALDPTGGWIRTEGQGRGRRKHHLQVNGRVGAGSKFRCTFRRLHPRCPSHQDRIHHN